MRLGDEELVIAH